MEGGFAGAPAIANERDMLLQCHGHATGGWAMIPLGLVLFLASANRVGYLVLPVVYCFGFFLFFLSVSSLLDLFGQQMIPSLQ